jgi:coiled-coil domain-containing protein 55
LQGADDVYDYDGDYDSFKRDGDSKKNKEEDRKSRYIGDLVKAADKRNRERDVINERKVAREQATEDAEADYRGKDKFVTAAYKEKLEERKLWQAEEDKQRREEETNDVTKKTGGIAMANFYGTLNRNVAMGATTSNRDGGPSEQESSQRRESDSNVHNESEPTKLSFTDGFETAESNPDDKQKTAGNDNEEADEEDPTTRRRHKRKRREQKVNEARERYLKRHGIDTGSV